MMENRSAAGQLFAPWMLLCYLAAADHARPMCACCAQVAADWPLSPRSCVGTAFTVGCQSWQLQMSEPCAPTVGAGTDSGAQPRKSSSTSNVFL
jgi:hypothetical protein